MLLLKPQFELAKNQLGKHGIALKNEYLTELCQATINWLISQKFTAIKYIKSPIKGRY